MFDPGKLVHKKEEISLSLALIQSCVTKSGRAFVAFVTFWFSCIGEKSLNPCPSCVRHHMNLPGGCWQGARVEYWMKKGPNHGPQR